MRTETTRLYKELLGLQGYRLEAPEPTPDPHPEASTMNLFKSFWLLGGLQSIDSRVEDDEAPSFAPTYGNRIASERSFGPAPREARDAEPIDPSDARVVHC